MTRLADALAIVCAILLIPPLSVAQVFLPPEGSASPETVVVEKPETVVEEKVIIPAGTRVYLQLVEDVSGRRRSGVKEGDLVRCRVWRSVSIDGKVVIPAGLEAMARVEDVRHAQIAGVKGKIVIGALEAQAIDGSVIELDGGYNKAGKHRIGLSVALGALVALPLIFITGKPAHLPEGTIFDAEVALERTVAVSRNPRPAPTAASLTRTETLGDSSFLATVDLSNLQTEKKPKFFYITAQRVPSGLNSLEIVRINGKPTDPMKVEVFERQGKGELETVRGKIRIRTLVKRLAKGINTFHLAYRDSSGRQVMTEVLLDIQI